MSRVFIFIVYMLCAPAAFAQTYVAAALGADLTKSYESNMNGTVFPDSERETIGWGLRVGTALGSRWGVELEFNRSGELRTQDGPIIYAQSGSVTTALQSTLLGLLDPGVAIFPTPVIRTDQRNTTWNASAWVRQSLGARADLVFLGGLGFSRVVQETDYSISAVRPLPAAITIPRQSYRTETTNYGVGPLVGAEALIRMTEHLELTPGIRVQSLGNDLAQGILVRPSVALGWIF